MLQLRSKSQSNPSSNIAEVDSAGISAGIYGAYKRKFWIRIVVKDLSLLLIHWVFNQFVAL
jgi:hypothetical protein